MKNLWFLGEGLFFVIWWRELCIWSYDIGGGGIEGVYSSVNLEMEGVFIVVLYW